MSPGQRGPGRRSVEPGVDGAPSPTLLRLAEGHQLDAGRFITHHFTPDQFEEAYDVFARAADTGALKIVLTRS